MRIYLLLTFIFILPITAFAQQNNIVEVTGHVVYQNSDEPIPGIIVEVLNQNKGVLTNYQGNFTIVVDKDDQLKLSALGLKTKIIDLPKDIDNKYITLEIEMDVDTIYLNELIISNLMTPEEFNYEFKYGYVPNTQLMNIRRNTGANAREILVSSLAKSGAENQQALQNYYSMKYGSEIGQNYIGTIGSLRAWREFINAWKNGDFRGKKK